MNAFNKKEIMVLCEKFNKKYKESPTSISEERSEFAEDVTVRYINSSFFNKVKASVHRDRRGEVVFCVIRTDGSIITVTCSEYPRGIFRIPTGGIGHGEDIVSAVYREVKEELGLDVEIDEFAGVVRIRFEHAEEHFMFYSYIFILAEKGGRLLLDASDDEISEVREVSIDELSDIVEALNNIQGKWSDWGKFRYVTSKAVLNILRIRAQT